MATKQTKTTGLATMENFNLSTFKQEQVPSAIEFIEAKIKELKGEDKEETVITGELPGFGRIENITDVMVLRAAYAQVAQKSAIINQHNEVFQSVAPSIKVAKYKEGGYSPEQWQKGILSQYKKIVFKEELEKLEKAKDKLQKHLSEEAKMKQDLKDVFSLLGQD